MSNDNDQNQSNEPSSTRNNTPEALYAAALELDAAPGNDAKAFELFENAALQGHAAAQRRIGLCYANGIGVLRDDHFALGWFRKAAAQGDAEASRELGLMYIEGRGVSRVYGRAQDWLQQALLQCHGDAKWAQNVRTTLERIASTAGAYPPDVDDNRPQYPTHAPKHTVNDRTPLLAPSVSVPINMSAAAICALPQCAKHASHRCGQCNQIICLEHARKLTKSGEKHSDYYCPKCSKSIQEGNECGTIFSIIICFLFFFGGIIAVIAEIGK